MQKNKTLSLKDCYKQYKEGKYSFSIKVNNDSLVELLNLQAPRTLSLPNNKEYETRLYNKGIDKESNAWYGLYMIDNFSQKLSYDEFKELYNLINKVEN